jgi:hypothetical protein
VQSESSEQPTTALDAAVEVEWAAALADSGFRTREASLFIVDGTGTGTGGRWWAPYVPAGDPLDGDQEAIAAAQPHVGRHRVAVVRPAADQPDEIAFVAAKMRHELEHARQWDAVGGDAFTMQQIARLVVGLANPGEFGVHVNRAPLEAAANAASSAFARARFPSDIVERVAARPDSGPLVRHTEPPDTPATLVDRTIAFLFDDYRDACARVETGGIPFPDWLDQHAPGTGVLWRRRERVAL